MSLPPPQTPTQQPVDTDAWALKALTRRYIGLPVWAIVLLVLIVPFVVYGTLNPSEDEPAPRTTEDRAAIAWGAMALSDQAAICDGYRMGGAGFTVDNLLASVDGNEAQARALFEVVEREC